jgi:hypothetical protein
MAWCMIRWLSVRLTVRTRSGVLRQSRLGRG